MLDELVRLSRRLGLPAHDLVILAEGNTSARTGDGHFAVKASGAMLADAMATDFVEVRSAPLMAAIRDERTSAADVDGLFAAATVGGQPRAPSTEAFLHAVGYEACGAAWVAHTHPTPVTGLLSSTLDDDALGAVLFPDEAVVGGVAPAIVPYADPGLELGRRLLRAVETYQDAHGRAPRIVLLRNHGLVAFGHTPAEVAAATLMATKAARVRLAALAAGGLAPLPPGAAEHLAARSDEIARLARLIGPADGDPADRATEAGA